MNGITMKHILFISWMILSTQIGAAINWLPTVQDKNRRIRTLECTYDKASLVSCKETGTDWKVSTEEMRQEGVASYMFTFTALRDLQQAGVAVAFDQYDWTSDNYLLIPASVYNGNRQRIVNRAYAMGLDSTDYYRKDLALTSNPIPQLSPEFGAPSRLEVLVNNTATPAIACLKRKQKRGLLLLTDQGIERNGMVLDHGLIVEESRDRSLASLVVSAPGVRSRKPEFIGFSESPDRGISVRKGETVQIRITVLDFSCQDVPELLAQFARKRKSHTRTAAPRDLMPMSEVFSQMARNIDERYYEGAEGSFYCPENADWMSYGWVGGLINTYPMLALGDAAHAQRVCHTFDFALPRAKGASGYYYDVLNADGKVLYRDAAIQHPEVGLTRKNADVLYWMVKQFQLLKLQGKEVKPAWEEAVCQLADAFVRTWQEEGMWGNYINVETGEIAVYNTTGGAMAVAGLTLAASYYQNPVYLQIAREAAADYYEGFALVGFTSGGCGDILQNADSETAIALTTSLMTLFESTGDSIYLKQAADLAHLCATWIISFNYRLPDDTPLAKLGANLTGAVWASTQNKHGAPGFCTQSGDALFKLYRATGDTLYAELLRDVIHAHAEGIQPNGKITERLTYCDADSRGSRGDGGQTGWNETNGALMSLEIPGLYLRTDKKQLYAFDAVRACIVRETDQFLWIEVTNPTRYDARVTLLAENQEEAEKPLGDHAFLRWKEKISVKAGKTIQVKIPK